MNDLVLVAGEALYDIVVRDDDALRAHPGGGPFNTARTIARLDQPVAYLGRMSSDRFGRTLQRMLASDRVRLDSVVHTDDPTTLAIAEMDRSGGGAEYRFYERGTAASGGRDQIEGGQGRGHAAFSGSNSWAIPTVGAPRSSFRGAAQRRARNPFSRGSCSWIPGLALRAIPE